MLGLEPRTPSILAQDIQLGGGYWASAVHSFIQIIIDYVVGMGDKMDSCPHGAYNQYERQTLDR